MLQTITIFRTQKTMLKSSHPHSPGSRSPKRCSIHELFLTKNHEILKSLLVSYATVIKTSKLHHRLIQRPTSKKAKISNFGLRENSMVEVRLGMIMIMYTIC